MEPRKRDIQKKRNTNKYNRMQIAGKFLQELPQGQTTGGIKKRNPFCVSLHRSFKISQFRNLYLFVLRIFVVFFLAIFRFLLKKILIGDSLAPIFL